MNTLQDFIKALQKMIDRHSKSQRSLELYLRALWAAALEYGNRSLTIKQILHMLEEAFVKEPADFESQWLEFTKMPDWTTEDEMYVITDFQDGKVVILESNVSDFEIFRRVIQFQIADLSRLDKAVFSDPNSYFGVDSPTKNRWYNITIVPYLQCAASYFQDASRGENIPLEQIDWEFLAWILKAGMSYE